MMLNITCAREVRGHAHAKKIDKNGAIWCILSVPKLVIINLKINFFFIINQQSKFVPFFLQDQSRCALWHKNKYIHILQGGSGGQ